MRDQIIELFNSALERDPSERSAFLSQACGHDDSLRAEIESLLSNYDQTFLEKSPAGIVSSFAWSTLIGKQIGAYRIVQECGRGGMAVVYVAERADQEYRKRVAIKMIEAGAHDEQLLVRFRNERQTLAALDHPNIVKLLDGGSTDAGLPYLVMEYIDGLPIDHYCDIHELSIPQRLATFQAVCSAVHYAHQNSVIHRDLKPTNILVTTDGVPHLLDFGIAKLLNPDCLLMPQVTRTHWRPMTPEYASPEQVQGGPVGRASDIYSLGVLLYKLLTGRHPFQNVHISGLELQRLICEQEPDPPSTAASKSFETVPEDETPKSITTPGLLAQARNTEPENLRRQLQGDLDNIVLMALRKGASQRYASAEEFSADIGRYLSSRPVRARKPTFTYRTGKFFRRHRESVVAVIIVFFIMAGFGFWQASSARKATFGRGPVRLRPSVAILGFKNLSGRPDTAWISTALSEMLTTELAAGEKLRAVPGETVARAKNDLSLPDAESLAPDTLARIHKNLGSDFVILGSYFDIGQAGAGQVRLDVRVQDTVKGETTAADSETGTEGQLLELISRTGLRLREQMGIGGISPAESSEIKAAAASNPDAMRLYSEGLAKLRTFDALAARDLLTSAVTADASYPLAHSALAKAWLALGYDSNAQQEAKKAMDLASDLSREDHLLVEARYYESSKQWEKAIDTYRTLFVSFPDNLEFGLYLTNAEVSGQRGKEALITINQLRSLPGSAKDDPQIDIAEVEAAASLSDNKRAVDAAERTVRKADAIGAKLLIARARIYQCRAFANLGQPNESKSACEEAQKIYQEAGDLGGVARALHNMAEVPIDQGELDQAKKLYQQALVITRQIGDKRGEGRELGNLALIAAEQGDFSTAEVLFRESIANSREIGNKYGLAVDMGNLGDLLHAEGRLPEALAAYKEALALAREVGHRSSEAIDIQDIGTVLADEGDLRAAMQMFQQALPIQRDIGERRYYAATLTNVGRTQRQQNDASGAKQSLEEALSIYEELAEKGNAAETKLVLGDLACDSGREAEAEELARASIQEFHTEKITDDEIMGEVLLSKSALAQGKLKQATEAIGRAATLSQKSRDVTVRIPRLIQTAHVRAAVKDFLGAERTAKQALSEAARLGFVQLQFEASLALGEIEIKAGSRAGGTARLEQLEKAARSKGFELIVQKALAGKS